MASRSNPNRRSTAARGEYIETTRTRTCVPAVSTEEDKSARGQPTCCCPVIKKVTVGTASSTPVDFSQTPHGVLSQPLLPTPHLPPFPGTKRSPNQPPPLPQKKKDTGNKISRRAKLEGSAHIILAGRVAVQADVCLRGDLVREANTSSSSAAAAATDDNGTTSGSKDPKPGGSSSSQSQSQTRTAISVGKYTLLSTGCTLHPPCRMFKAPPPSSSSSAIPSTDTAQQPSTQLSYYHQKIGEHVLIGAHAHVSAAVVGSYVHVGAYAIVGNGCVIKDNVKVLEGAVMPDGMVAPPGTVVGGVPARVLGDVGDGWGVGGGGGAAGGIGAGGMGIQGFSAGEEPWSEGGELRELIRSVK